VQEWLGLPQEVWDDSPALLTTMMKHRGKGDSVHNVMSRKLADAIKKKGTVPYLKDTFPLNSSTSPSDFGLDSDDLLDVLREAYEEVGVDAHFWDQCDEFIFNNS
jgi:hypothetical protein